MPTFAVLKQRFKAICPMLARLVAIAVSLRTVDVGLALFVAIPIASSRAKTLIHELTIVLPRVGSFLEPPI